MAASELWKQTRDTLTWSTQGLSCTGSPMIVCYLMIKVLGGAPAVVAIIHHYVKTTKIVEIQILMLFLPVLGYDSFSYWQSGLSRPCHDRTGHDGVFRLVSVINQQGNKVLGRIVIIIQCGGSLSDPGTDGPISVTNKRFNLHKGSQSDLLPTDGLCQSHRW